MTHIIRQQYFHVEVNGTESDGLAVHRQLPEVYRSRLLPALEQTLERYAPPDGVLYVERLDVDIGTLTLDRLEHDLAAAVTQAIEHSLREHIASRVDLQTTSSSSSHLRTAAQSLNAAFLYFLRTGSLPWSLRLPHGSSLEDVILNSWQDPSQSSDSSYHVTAGLHSELSSPTVRQRLIRQFSPGFLRRLLAQLAPEGVRVLEKILQVVQTSVEFPVESKALSDLLWERMFAYIARNNIPTATALVREAWQALPSTTAAYTRLAAELEQHWPTTTDKAAVHTSAQVRTKLVAADPDHALISEHDQTKELPRQAGEHPEAKEGIYIDNAGLVLLHPFLAQFFTALGIVVDDRLEQPERALGLLHFLTTGQSVAPEYELVLPKILCNIPLNTAVEFNVELTDREKEEATALLEAVIRYWDVLQNTSPDGLRGTFLLRPGKVSLRDDGDWLVQVESNAFDILLDRLPWGMSVIKLPWMESMLWVEWH